MEHVIATLLRDFEEGRMSRRQLIQSLAMAATAVAGVRSAAAAPAPAPDTKGFKAVTVNHISYGVADYARTRDFYADLFGMTVSHDDGKQCYLSFGDTFIIPRKTRQPDGKPYVDHIAYTIADWNKDQVEAELKRRGLEPRPDTENSFHVKDPDGFDLQISGKEMKP
jgi:catechol 2,3-dioxygenase-like lactoylglutathione lyase family enzyme